MQAGQMSCLQIRISNPPAAQLVVTNRQQLRQRKCLCHAAPVVFEPQVDSQALTAQLVVLSVTAATAAYWWLSVVPSARRTLAKEKRAGPLNQYLNELQEDSGRELERWFYTDWLRQLQQRQQMARAAAAKRAAAAAVQPTTLTGSQQQAQQQERQHVPGETTPAQPSSSLQDPQTVGADVEDDKVPSFWSLDNPILATAAILAAIALVSSLAHQ
jgi:hypothetical protein